MITLKISLLQFNKKILNIYMDKYKNIMIYRIGKNGDKMESICIVKILKKNKNYRLVDDSFEETTDEIDQYTSKIIKPPITILNGKWNFKKIIKSTSMENINKIINKSDDIETFQMDFFTISETDSETDSSSDNIYDSKNTSSNIHGNNIKLSCFSNNYYLKPIQATKENVAYYDCKLLDQNEVFNFKSKKDMAIFEMIITFDYVNDYVMNEGSGLYLEHLDIHHIHIPTEVYCSGYIILAKEKSNNIFEISAFQIPYGKALIIPPNVIHNDCFLVGKFNIVYGTSKNYTTGILKYYNELVKFTFL